jgi:uncharacterized protein
MTSTVVPMPDAEGADRTQKALAKFAPSSVLGMFALAAATFVVSARMTHWYGNLHSAFVLFPLVLIFGGLAQFYAGALALQTRDVVALTLHGTWGSFWTAYGILEILYATGRVTRPTGAFAELGFWFIVVAAISWSITVAARERTGIMTVVLLLACGSTLGAIGELAGIESIRILAGYFLMASALVAWYVATAVMLRFVRIEKTHHVEPVSGGQSMRAA